MRNPPDVPGVRSQRTRFQKLLAYLKRYWFLYLLVLPGFVFMIVFNYGPMYGIQLAFKDYHANLGIWGSPWVGLQHFREMIADANFWRAAKNTLIINGYNIVFKTTFTIFLALMLNELRLKKVKSCVQTAAYLPYFLSWVIFAGLVPRDRRDLQHYQERGLRHDRLSRVHVHDQPGSVRGGEDGRLQPAADDAAHHHPRDPADHRDFADPGSVQPVQREL